MRFRSSLIILSCCIVTALLIAACKSGMKSVVSSENIPAVEKKVPLVERFGNVVAGIADWKSMSVPVSVNISSPVSISFNGRAYFTHGHSVYISLRKLGFEVAQLYVTSDSIYVVDKFNKRYIAESLEGVSANCPVTIGDVQNLFLGQPFLPGERLSLEKFTFENREKSWLAIPVKQPEAMQFGFVFSLDSDTLDALAVQSGPTLFTVEYSGHQSSPGGPVASADAMMFKSPRLTVAVTLRWAWNQSRWNSPDDNKTWSMPKGNYKRMNAASLLKALKSQSQL